MKTLIAILLLTPSLLMAFESDIIIHVWDDGRTEILKTNTIPLTKAQTSNLLEAEFPNVAPVISVRKSLLLKMKEFVLSHKSDRKIAAAQALSDATDADGVDFPGASE